MQIPQKRVSEKFSVHEIAAVNLSKLYFLKNAKKTCKPNNRDLNRDWTKNQLLTLSQRTNMNSSLMFSLNWIRIRCEKNLDENVCFCHKVDPSTHFIPRLK